jgi:hypothetical protein
MHLWKNEGGVPSIADAVLVTSGPIAAIAATVVSIDPILNFMEPKGTMFGLLGYASIFVILFSLVGGVAALIWRSAKQLRPEIQPPRIAFLVLAPILVMVTTQLGQQFFTIRFVLDNQLPVSTFTYVFYGSVLIALFLAGFGYFVVSRIALRFPQKTARYSVYFLIGVSILGVIGKIAKLALVAGKRG